MKEKVNLYSDIDFHDMGALKLCYDLEKKIFDLHLEHYSDRNKEFIPLILRFENIIEIKINHSESSSHKWMEINKIVFYKDNNNYFADVIVLLLSGGPTMQIKIKCKNINLIVNNIT